MTGNVLGGLLDGRRGGEGVCSAAMWTRNFDPFPLAAVRDLLGIVRVMYLHAKDRDPGRAARLRRIGESLAIAVDLGARCATGTGGHAAAWKRAEEANLALADLIDPLEPAEPLVEVAQQRVLRRMGKRAV